MQEGVSRQSVCRTRPATAPLMNLGFPFEQNHEVYCTHSFGVGSHSWVNAFYSLDLATAYDKPPATIIASEAGKAFVFLGDDGKLCPQKLGTPEHTPTDHCGLSWGNRIKILHSNGYYSFYVHLERVLIKSGESVRKGQPIGIEGWTGAAGHRHLHWGIQKLPGKNASEWETQISWDGESVPFEFEALVNGKRKKINSATFQCAHANIGKAPPEEQPLLKSVEH